MKYTFDIYNNTKGPSEGIKFRKKNTTYQPIVVAKNEPFKNGCC